MGQLLGSLQGGQVGSAVDEASKQQALETARRSFERAAREEAEEIVAEAGRGELSEETLAHHVEAETERFVAQARERLIEEQGDGVLTWNELTRELADEREQRLDAVAERVRAALDGAELPPSLGDFESTTRWVAATARYILVERNAPLRWALCLGALVVGLFVAGFAGRGLERAAERLAGKGARATARAADDLSGPLYLAATAIAVRVAVGWVWLPVGVAEGLRKGANLLIAVSLLWLAWRAADGLAGFLGWATSRARGRVDDELVDLARKGLRIVAITGFAAFAVNALLGVELTSILATVGVIGIVVSIAAQDTLRNMMGAFTVYGDRPFAVGDLVRIKSYFGTVEEIGFRSTRVRTLEGHRVVVPNAEVVREPVENVSARPSVRHHYAIDLVYATPPDRVRRAVEILEEILTEADPPEDQPPRVSFEAFGAHSLRLEIWYYSNTPDYWEARAHRTEVNATILERFNEEGLEFAFPTRSLYVMPGDEPEEA